MSSRKTRADAQGQLALVDAMVFFAAMLLVSGMLAALCMPESESPQKATAGSRGDPATVLRVFLGSSLGAPVFLDKPMAFMLDSRQEVAECLAVEVQAVESGIAVSCFRSLNDMLLSILVTLCGLSLEPSLEVVRMTDFQPETLIEFGHELPKSQNIYASSTELPGSGDHVHLVKLELAPALLPEHVDV